MSATAPSAVAGTQPSAPTAGTSAVAEVSTELIRHQRLMHRLKTEMADWTPEGMDWGAHTVLMYLVSRGPMRQSALADCSLLDPSTISRRVSQLVSGGYVRRQPDPADGRAVQLAASDTGQAVFDRIAARRQKLIQQLFDDWSPIEVQTFLTNFRRLNDRLEQVHAAPDAAHDTALREN